LRFLFAGLLCLAACGLPAQVPVFQDWGPFYSRRIDTQGHERTRALGPVYEHTVTPEGWSLRAARPFFIRWNHDGDGFLRREVLWPLAQTSRLGDQRSWRVLLTYGTNWDVNDPESRYRLWVLPFYFQGRDTHGESYRALFPVGGRLHEFLFWDEIEFYLFPIHLRSRVKQIEARSWFWPVYSRTEGPGIRRFRIFPFYGFAEREGMGRKQFLFWPIWTSVRYERPKETGSGWILFPLTGHLKLENQESWWILPPFFRYHTGGEKSRFFGPWPFVQISTGAVEKRYFWPVYGTKTIGNTQKDFFLWPIVWRDRTRTAEENKSRHFVVPFYQDFRVADAEKDETQTRHTKVWPLYSHSYRAEGPVRRTVFPDLNPFRAGPIERNFAPFWQLYVREQVGEDVDTEIFWGLYRSAQRGEDRYRSLFPLYQSARSEGRREWNLLKGLVGYERVGEKKSWRVLYLLRFGDREEKDASEDP